MPAYIGTMGTMSAYIGAMGTMSAYIDTMGTFYPDYLLNIMFYLLGSLAKGVNRRPQENVM